MTERYFGKVVAVRDEYTVVMDKGLNCEVATGQRYLVVGLGDVISDPETGEELERLEIVRGRVSVMHVQEKIATLKSCDYESSEDTKEIKKVTSRGGLAMFGPQDTITESITPGKRNLKALDKAEVGDYLIRI